MPRIRYRFSNNPVYFEGFIERTYVTKSDVLRFLERDRADLSHVISVRFKTGRDEAFSLLQDDSFIRIDEVLTVLLMLPGTRADESTGAQVTPMNEYLTAWCGGTGDVVADVTGAEASYRASGGASSPAFGGGGNGGSGGAATTTPRRAVSFSPGGNQVHQYQVGSPDTSGLSASGISLTLPSTLQSSQSQQQPPLQASQPLLSQPLTQPRSASPARSRSPAEFDARGPELRSSSLYAGAGAATGSSSPMQSLSRSQCTFPLPLRESCLLRRRTDHTC